MVSCGSCVTSSACVLIAMVPPLSDQPSTFAWGCAGTADCRRLDALRGLWQHDGEHAVVIGCLHVVTPDVPEHRHLQAELAVQDTGQVIGGGAGGHCGASPAG